MIERICHIDNELEDSIFLFGARQTGKSTFLRHNYPDAIYFNLLDTSLKNCCSIKHFFLCVGGRGQQLDSNMRRIDRKLEKCHFCTFFTLEMCKKTAIFSLEKCN